jgi:hypothetical protein
MRTLALTLLISSIAAAALPGPAAARKDQRSIIQDDARVLAGSTRDATLDEMKALGVETVKISIFWRDLASDRPANPEDPGAYPAAKWSAYDAAVQAAAARGLEVFLNGAGPAPDWAVSQKSDPAGVYRPNAAEFGRFAKAVGVRYSGSYSPPGSGGGGGSPPPPSCPPKPLPCPAPPMGSAFRAFAADDGAPAAAAAAGPLPAVRLWSVWNEPNLPRFLLPQRSSTRSHFPVSPHLYRGLYLAARDGLAGSGHPGDVILMGELLPVGKSAKTPRSSLRPLEFLREVACVDSRYRAFKGGAAKERGCSGFKALPLSGLAHHPYTLAGGPTTHPPNRDDASIATLSRLTKALDRLKARKRLAVRGRVPLWLTEFGVQTDPPDFLFGAPIGKVPSYLGLSERIAFVNPRVMSYSQYPLVDDRTNRGFQSGLRFSSGKAKPAIYTEYRLPIYVTRIGGGVSFFGGVRAAESGTVVLEARTGSRAQFTRIATAKLGARGYFLRRVRVGRAQKKQFRFSFGKSKSIVVTAH